MGIFSATYHLLNWLWAAVKSIFSIGSHLPLVVQQLLILIILVKLMPVIEKLITALVKMFIWLFNKFS